MDIDDLFGKEVATVGVRGNIRFSAEEVISCAIIELVFSNVNIIRTTDVSVLQNTDILLGTNITNHAHVFNRVHDNIGYISVISAVWKEFGRHAIQNLLNTDSENAKTIDGFVESVWREINSEYMANVDNSNESKDGIEEILAIMNLPYSDHDESNRQFDLAVSMAKNWLIAVIIRKQRFLRKIVTTAEKDYNEASEIFTNCSDIAVFSKENKMWNKVYINFCNTGKHVPKLVVLPNSFSDGGWTVILCSTPAPWRRKLDFMAKGGTDIEYTHSTSIIGRTETKEEAIALAEEWLKS